MSAVSADFAGLPKITGLWVIYIAGCRGPV